MNCLKNINPSLQLVIRRRCDFRMLAADRSKWMVALTASCVLDAGSVNNISVFKIVPLEASKFITQLMHFL